jgi:hypothetical protein
LFSNSLSKNVKIKINRNKILPVVLYGCETWSLIVREKHKEKIFAKKVVRRIFGLKKNDETGKWRKLHIEEFHGL